jgi:ABC-type multidrug transport system ATPase subunit
MPKSSTNCLHETPGGLALMKIELRGITKSYGKTRALDHISLELTPGQIVALLGVNGSGKTTLLRTLYGLVAPDKGALLYDDEEFSRDNIALRREMFFLPDFPFVFPEM